MLLNSLLATTWYPIAFNSPMNIARGVAFWLTVAIALAFVICTIVLKGEARKKSLRYWLLGGVIYACAVGLMFLIWTFVDDGISALAFAPLLVLIVAIGTCAVLIAWKPNKTMITVSASVVGAALVATLVCMGVYYAKNVAGDGYYNSDAASVNQIVLYVSAVVLIALIVGCAFLFDKGGKGFDSKSIAYAAICIAMSFALSYIRIVKLPQGGSVTIASLLPLMIYSYMFGVKKGVFAGFIYGILQAVQDPWIIHPAQFLLDYPIAFAGIGLAGIFAEVKQLEKLPQVQFLLGAIVASVLRFASHVLSGVFAFSAYAVDAGMNAWPYSLAYNSFVFVDIAIVIVVGVLVFSSKAFVKQARKFQPKNEPEAPSEETPSEV